MGVRSYLSNRLRQGGVQTKLLREIRQELVKMQATNAAMATQLKKVNKHLERTRQVEEVIRFSLSEKVLHEVTRFSEESVLDFETTLRRVAKERLSFARFGDGELRIMLNPDYNLGFQAGSAPLRRDLQAVLTYQNYDQDRLLVGFPYLFRSPHWQKVWSDSWPRLREILPRDVQYGVAHVSRPIFFGQVGALGVDLWREVWDGQRVCVVTGRGSRFTMVDELFDNVASVDYLYSEPRNAYGDIGRVLEEAERLDDADLFLVSLGPAGTILTAELSRIGKWAIDIGHLSASYEQAFKGAGEPEDRPVSSE
ncbi:GT-D fold domain-containing glycosyltransferase [Glycomyces paridis]|nr:GT-D fold domain-containing glycosyltransferase [Glycomyces paridis]